MKILTIEIHRFKNGKEAGEFLEKLARKGSSFGLLQVALFILGDVLLGYLFPGKEQSLTRNVAIIVWGLVVFLGFPRLRCRKW
ncbi:hypothetical protein CL1_0875 [Thermococcus cleftensis]|uniref:Uncharacterized protein n=1 Tax=Thermococcus cleftensis (strain DSM 27260 / KACC 17922 / CL1) TaxID=163003 RepID=I3ZTP6_THECF|nr:hypothetical protein [Thermococcus cleftensis]AFL95080.1 hypothetical protein CL1_0875 [Thermococcus cleftensis]